MKTNKREFWLLFLFVCTITCFSLFSFCREPDYFWHIKAGEYMFHHGVLTHDVFSWFVTGKYWMSHEWLFEILLYGMKLLFGSAYTFLYCFICSLALGFLIFFPNFRSVQKNVYSGFVFYSFFAFLTVTFIQARPHMLSFCFFALTIWFLVDLYHNSDSKKIYFLPLISILWSNVHGGSSNLPYLFCFLFLLGGSFSFQFKKIEANKMSKRQLKKYFWVMILCMIGVCINIHGFKMFLYPYQNMMDQTMLSNISEWQGTSLNVPYHYVYYLFLLFLISVLLISDRKIQFMDLLLMGFVTYLGLKSIRFWLFTPIAMSYILFDYVPRKKYRLDNYLGFCLLSLAFIACFAYKMTKWSTSSYLYLNSSMISVLKKEEPKRLFNMYDFGGELIYHDIPVFIDGRADLYSNYNYKDYLHISKLEEDYVALIHQYDFDYFIVDNHYPIYTYLKYHPDFYELIYFYDSIYIYKKIVN